MCKPKIAAAVINDKILFTKLVFSPAYSFIHESVSMASTLTTKAMSNAINI